MDLLFKRYADPFSFINGMISTGRFCEWVLQIIQTINKENSEKTSWEFYLHKVWEGTYAEFADEMENNAQNQDMTVDDIEATITESMDILKNFTPEKEGGERK